MLDILILHVTLFILAEVNLENTHKFIVADRMYEVKYISIISMDSQVKILIYIFCNKKKNFSVNC